MEFSGTTNPPMILEEGLWTGPLNRENKIKFEINWVLSYVYDFS